MANNDPFSSSVIPFEVPEQMRAFAEKGVSQARDSYAKFKDVAESHNGTIEAVFTSATKGASAYSAKLMELMKANTSANLDFAQALIGVKSPSEAMELWTSHACCLGLGAGRQRIREIPPAAGLPAGRRSRLPGRKRGIAGFAAGAASGASFPGQPCGIAP